MQLVLLRDGPLEKLWGGGGGGFSSRRNLFSLSNSLYELFFRPQQEYFFRINWRTRLFFHSIFPCANIFFVLRPPPADKFSNGLSLIFFVYPIEVPGEFDPLSYISTCLMHVNKTKFERNSPLKYYHRTCNGKTNLKS